jgi:hypothetical protein
MRQALATLVAVLCLGGGVAQGMPAFYSPPACQDLAFHSEPLLGAQRACMNVGVRTHGTERRTYLFLTQANTGAGVYRDNGSLVWWHRRPQGATQSYDASIVHLWGHPYLAVWSGRVRYVGNNQSQIRYGTVALFNEHYRQVGTITAGRPFSPDRLDMHEFRITPQGDALVDIYRPVRMKLGGHSVVVLDCVVQKLSLVRDSSGIHTGKVLFQWSSLKHVPLASSRFGEPGPGGGWDYFHLNAVAQDTDGNLLLSARDTWGIYKVNVKTGRIIWRLGAIGSPTLRVPWCYQHDITPLGGHEYSLYDDGAAGPGCFLGSSGHAARALIFRVDESTRPVRVKLIRAVTHKPRIYSEFIGSVQRLDDGNLLVSWGTTPQITEYNPQGRVLMDLSLSQQSYRGLRFAWTGLPAQPPSVAAARQLGGGTRVWASWNGSTEVRAWRVLAGLGPRHMRAVTGRLHKEGFETSISLAGTFADVAVQALGKNGQVLATSHTINPATG